jgi:hypothetical protein
MRYTSREKDLIEAILYFEYRIGKAKDEILKRHTKRSLINKLQKARESREELKGMVKV